MILKRLALLAITALLLTGCFEGAPETTGSGHSRTLPMGWHAVHGHVVHFPDGTPRSIADPGRGRLVLINFWASFCGPCKTEVPLLARLDAGGDVRVLGVSRDLSSEYAAKALHAGHATYPDVIDTNATYMSTFAGLIPLNQIPSSVLVRNGQAIAVHIGPFDTWKDLARGIAASPTSP